MLQRIEIWLHYASSDKIFAVQAGIMAAMALWAVLTVCVFAIRLKNIRASKRRMINQTINLLEKHRIQGAIEHRKGTLQRRIFLSLMGPIVVATVIAAILQIYR